MLAGWIARRNEVRDVAADADALRAMLGRHAYDFARERARSARAEHHYWDAVRRALARRAGRRFLDTATRMLWR